MGPAAAGLYQQGHTDLHKKSSSLCESWGQMCLEISCLTTLVIEQYKWLSILA